MEEYPIQLDDSDEETNRRVHALGIRPGTRHHGTIMGRWIQIRQRKTNAYCERIASSEFVTSMHRGMGLLNCLLRHVRNREGEAIRRIQQIESSGKIVPESMYRIATYLFRNRMVRQCDLHESRWVLKMIRLKLYLRIIERTIQTLKDMGEEKEEEYVDFSKRMKLESHGSLLY